MDPSNLTAYTPYAIGFLIFGIVGAVRKEKPSLDGLWVILTAVVLSVLASFAAFPKWITYATLRPILWFAFQTAGTAIALATGINYTASKFNSPASPPTSSNSIPTILPPALLTSQALSPPRPAPPPASPAATRSFGFLPAWLRPSDDLGLVLLCGGILIGYVSMSAIVGCAAVTPKDVYSATEMGCVIAQKSLGDKMPPELSKGCKNVTPEAVTAIYNAVDVAADIINATYADAGLPPDDASAK